MRIRHAIVVLGVGVLALTAASGALSRAARKSAGALRACPTRDRNVPISRSAGATSSVVPMGARQVLLCRYSGLDSFPQPVRGAFGLRDDLLVTQRATVASLASQLNRLPVPPRVVACPADDGEAIVAIFRYRSGVANPVDVGLSGCTLVTNDHLTRCAALAAGRRLLDRLMAMTSGMGVGISSAVRAALLKDALRDARDAGDQHPFDIQAIKTTYLEAESLFGPDRSYDMPASAPVYAFAERGEFTAYLAPAPPGAPAPTGTVQGAILTKALRVTDGYLNNRYPRLRSAGRPVQLR